MDALFGVVPHDEEKLRSGQLGAAVAVKHLDDDESEKNQTAVQIERVPAPATTEGREKNV